MITQKCGMHRDREAEHQCSVCERWYCNDCLLTEGEAHFCRSSLCSKKYIELVKKRVFIPPAFIPDEKSSKFIRRTASSFCFFSFLNIVMLLLSPVSDIGAGSQYSLIFSMLPGAGNIMRVLGSLFEFVTFMSVVDKVFAIILFFLALLLFSKKKFARVLFLLSLYFGLYYILVFYLIMSLYGGNVLTVLGDTFISPQILHTINIGYIVFSIFMTIPAFAFIWLIIRFSMSPVKQQFH